MRIVLILLIGFVFVGCSTNEAKTEDILASDNNSDWVEESETSLVNQNTIDSSLEEESLIDDQNMNAYIVVADTSISYYKLHSLMFALSEKLNLEIDTMSRGYNESKNLICLPEDDEDEIYAGDYFPRRYPTNTLSIEHNGFYAPEGAVFSDNVMMLMVSISDSEEEAKSILEKVKKHHESAFIINSTIFMGCMH